MVLLGLWVGWHNQGDVRFPCWQIRTLALNKQAFKPSVEHLGQIRERLAVITSLSDARLEAIPRTNCLAG